MHKKPQLKFKMMNIDLIALAQDQIKANAE